jgi:hypothetical protein
LLDDAVAVEVVGLVLVDQPVPVVVDRDVARTGVNAGRGFHEVLPAVGIDGRNDVEDPLVNEFRDVVETAVVLHQVPGRVEADLGALDFVAVDVGLDVHGRLAHLRARLGVVDRQDHEVPAFAGLADGLELEELGESVLEPLEVRVKLGDVMPAVKIELDLERWIGGLLAEGRGRA